MAKMMKAGDEGLPEPTEQLTEEEAEVTVPDGDDLMAPTDIGFDGEEWDGNIDDLPSDDEAIANELDSAASEGE